MSAFHAGEIEVQRAAGARAEAEQVGRIIADRIPEDLPPLLEPFRLAVAASIDGRGRVWASLLTGPAGFLEVVDETRLDIEAHLAAGDPLRSNLNVRPEMGLLVIDPASRRRLRFNGRGAVRPDGGLSLKVEQVYGNCRKYIQARRLQPQVRPPSGTVGPARTAAARRMPAEAAPTRATVLSGAQRAWIGAADTFFIGSAHPEGGADASHRGGRPGFVSVGGERALSFPDYPGNNMFNTLGNLAADPRAGLLFVDFERGDLLQLTGRARLVRDPEALARHRGARHVVVEYEIDEVLETPGGSPLRFTLVEPSPFNP
jgi:predicted pyridoxine 5'-phosphate oxidase superfamily flavin-nucleotide-binding protein